MGANPKGIRYRNVPRPDVPEGPVEVWLTSTAAMLLGLARKGAAEERKLTIGDTLVDHQLRVQGSRLAIEELRDDLQAMRRDNPALSKLLRDEIANINARLAAR